MSGTADLTARECREEENRREDSPVERGCSMGQHVDVNNEDDKTNNDTTHTDAQAAVEVVELGKESEDNVMLTLH